MFREVDERRWRDLVQLFERPGGPKHCWCMVWRPMPSAQRREPAARKAALQHLVRQGIPVGILGYAQGEPVAWASVAPRPTYRPLGSPDDLPEPPERVWSLVCFFVARPMRGRGLLRALIAAAVAAARRHGATVLEASPVGPRSPSYRFMGTTAVFRDAGFREVGRAGTRRHVMRLWLRPPRT